MEKRLAHLRLPPGFEMPENVLTTETTRFFTQLVDKRLDSLDSRRGSWSQRQKILDEYASLMLGAADLEIQQWKQAFNTDDDGLAMMVWGLSLLLLVSADAHRLGGSELRHEFSPIRRWGC